MRSDANSPDDSDARHKPFEVITRAKRHHLADRSAEEQVTAASESPDSGFSVDDMDRLYREALEAMEEVAADLTDACGALSRPDSFDEDQEIRAEFAEASVVDRGTIDTNANQHPENEASPAGAENPITPRQIIEAALFVGGMPLTSKKLCGLLRGDFSADFVEQSIEELNSLYLAEGRPYEIRLGEGGYRMVVRSEFEAVRNRVFGVGPREVRLTQEALEVLSLVAYKQPISKAEVEASGRDNAGNVLRQLIRRELVTIQRAGKGRDDVRFTTTPRFLELFGLGRLDELPHADELDMK
ncbi:MAG: SMC-Scp complex subunit ScpB [Planctomycetaceae bacterium]